MVSNGRSSYDGDFRYNTFAYTPISYAHSKYMVVNVEDDEDLLLSNLLSQHAPFDPFLKLSDSSSIPRLSLIHGMGTCSLSPSSSTISRSSKPPTSSQEYDIERCSESALPEWLTELKLSLNLSFSLSPLSICFLSFWYSVWQRS